MEIVALTSFLAPFLPYVVQAGQKVAGKAADVIGEEAANYAEKLWERLRPGVEQKPAAQEAVADALALGYRHIDTASSYGNEREVGAALRESDVPRDEVWVTTKVWRDDLEPDRLRRSAEASLRDLGLDRVDLLLVHWPNPAVRLGDTLAALQRELRQETLPRPDETLAALSAVAGGR